jgi:rhamnose utilization protein RhaD (predicted bifunctional aldolase and dehydrogenase)/NAD(P)-dependent dehydrogenase (short-subunit alcohol dehydrogenase family)
MISHWSDSDALLAVERDGPVWGEDLALRTYSARLLGAESSLVLHGGGNTSVKTGLTDIFGDTRSAIFVKASGADMALVGPQDHLPLDLAYLRRMRGLHDLADAAMVAELRGQMLRPSPASPSMEALVHAFLPAKYIDHTHADAVLAITNRRGGEGLVQEALGDDVIVLPYVTPGFRLALAAAQAIESSPCARGMVWARHGIVTWGETARESYEAMIELVSRAEGWLAAHASPPVGVVTTTAQALDRVGLVAPMLRGLLARPSGNPDRPNRRVILQSLVTPEALAFLDRPAVKDLALTSTLTSDHLIRTRPWPAWVDGPDYNDPVRLKGQLQAALQNFAARYNAYLGAHEKMLPDGMARFDPVPAVVLLPGLGALCAGPDLRDAIIARDITEHTLAVKASMLGDGTYEGLPEEDLFRMEYRTLQHAKLARSTGSLSGEVALVTGAAGAIGSGVCRALLEEGCLVAATDLPGRPLDTLVAGLGAVFGPRVVAVPLDVTDASSVSSAFQAAAGHWGGVDLVVVNAGIAHVSPLEKMEIEAFRRLERVNVEGTLLVISESARHFRTQGTGGDIVLVSTKNVFAPGAKFGAYSATKAASHQLARIASLELAEIDVRVNMVSPDAVFSGEGRRSGLWAEVGPDRMRARGLDEAGLEAYYRSRNLLKAEVTARHVANAILFFAARLTPTTGATIPVDGGLPDATPR